MSSGTVPAEESGQAAARRREQRGWYVYDWACSVYSTSVLTVFLGPYLTSVAKAAADSEDTSTRSASRSPRGPSSPTPSPSR